MIRASTLIERAARRIDDIRLTNVTTPDLLDYLNAVCDDLCTRLEVYERIVVFKVYAEDLYAYPSDLVQVKWMSFNPDPVGDPDGYKPLGEKFEDEFREDTFGTYPTSEPCEYFASQGYFHLFPRPETIIPDGGKMGYWATPDPIVNAATGFFQLPDFLQHHVVDGMVIHALRQQKRYEEANTMDAVWRAGEADKARPIVDRSSDRRSGLRPRPGSRFEGQI